MGETNEKQLLRLTLFGKEIYEWLNGFYTYSIEEFDNTNADTRFIESGIDDIPGADGFAGYLDEYFRYVEDREVYD